MEETQYGRLFSEVLASDDFKITFCWIQPNISINFKLSGIYGNKYVSTVSCTQVPQLHNNIAPPSTILTNYNPGPKTPTVTVSQYHPPTTKVSKYEEKWEKRPYSFKYVVPEGKYQHEEISDTKETQGLYEIETSGFESRTVYSVNQGSGFNSQSSYSIISN